MAINEGKRPPITEARTDGDTNYDQGVADYEQRCLAWLNRPRLHTAIFEASWEDDELARKMAEAKIIPVNFEELNQRRSKRRAELKELTKELHWSDERLNLFTQVVVTYRRNPTIDNYLRIRRDFPEVEIQVGQLGGIESVFALEKDFESVGIEPRLVAAALDSDEPSVDALCLRLLELLAFKDNLPSSVPGYHDKRREAISDTTVNYLIAEVMEAYDWHNDDTFRIPASLVVLIRHQLCGLKPDLHERVLTHEKKSNMGIAIGRLLKPNEKLSINKLAKMTGVARTTAARWLAEDEFKTWVEMGRKMSDPRSPLYVKLPEHDH